MKIRLLCVGRPRDLEAAALHDRYAERIVRFGIAYGSDWVPEVRSGTRFSDDHVREREARALLERIGDRDTVLALDAGGDPMSSEDVARHLERWATPGATFVIGGPLGLHPNVLDRADRTWSLSRLTLPHELARVVVVEQLYRAVTITRRVPYHK